MSPAKGILNGRNLWAVNCQGCFALRIPALDQRVRFWMACRAMVCVCVWVGVGVCVCA